MTVGLTLTTSREKEPVDITLRIVEYMFMLKCISLEERLGDVHGHSSQSSTWWSRQRRWTVHVRNLWLDLRGTSFLFSEIPERSKPTLNLFTSLIPNMQEKTKCPNDRLDLNSNLVFLNIEVLPWSFHRYRAKTIFRKRLSDHFQTQKWIKPDTMEF